MLMLFHHSKKYLISPWLQLGIVLKLSMTLSQATPVDWYNSWDGTTRTLTGAFQSDPQDPRTTMRGSGSIALGGGLAIMNGSPRLYISPPDSQTAGFENLEFTVWGKFENFGTLKSYSGLTIVVRSNHENYYDNGCDAAGYYFRIRAAGAENGFLTFQKEYYHSTTAGTVYSSSTYQETATFPGGIPLQQWIGIKFRATTIRSADGTYDEKVHLEAYIDLADGFQGGDWQLAFEYYDVLNGGTMSATKTVPPECSIQSGIPIFGARSTVFLRSDGDMNTEVHWKDASVTEISPIGQPSKGPTNSPTISHAPTKSPTQKPVKTRPTKPPKGDGGGGGEKPTKPPKGDGGDGGGGGGGKGKMNVDCLQNLLRGFLGNGR